MSMERSLPDISRKQIGLAFLVVSTVFLVTAVVRIGDYHPLAPNPSPSPVPTDASPGEIFAQAETHLTHSPVTIRVNKRTTGQNVSLSTHRIYKLNVERDRFFAYTYQVGDGGWVTTCTYRTDGMSASKSGSVHSPSPPEFCQTGENTDWNYNKFKASPVEFHIPDRWEKAARESNAWTITSRNESVVVLETTGNDGYVAATGNNGTVSSFVSGNLTVYVDAETGQITRFNRVVIMDDGSTKMTYYTSTTFSQYGTTDVSPPDSLPSPSLSGLLRDFLHY